MTSGPFLSCLVGMDLMSQFLKRILAKRDMFISNWGPSSKLGG